MKAALHTQYGPSELLKVGDVEKPEPKENEILIKIFATTVTTTDCNFRNFTFVPRSLLFPIKLQFGINKPKVNILGVEASGVVEKKGQNVKNFNIGDNVFGSPEPNLGTHAEYVCIPENRMLTNKPSNASWEEAAALVNMGNTALFYLKDLASVQSGQEVLINGASGGIGTFAIQIACYFGARVTAVCSTSNLDLVRSLGAEKVIDYTKEDFIKNQETYDVIFDVVANRTFSECKNSLNSNGLFLPTLPSLSIIFHSLWTCFFCRKKVKFGSAPAKAENLEYLKNLYENEKIKTIIDQRFKLEQISNAFGYVEKGHRKGNVVVMIRE
jgi:NADPH:quinone reductase-like Zn-dependent oxidoreductase